MGRLGKFAKSATVAIAGVVLASSVSLAVPGPTASTALAAPSAPFTAAAGRLLDTRVDAVTVDGRFAALGRLAAGSTTVVQVGGRAGVPADARAVAVTVTVVDPLVAGFVTVFPCGPLPGVSTVNVAAGQTAAGSTVAMLDGSGQLCVSSMMATHVVVDVTGTLGDAYVPVAPGRLLDSRPGFVTADGQSQAIGLLAASSVTEVQVSGRLGVPIGATAAALTVTVTGSTLDGFLSVFPCGPRPLASTVNHRARATVSNSSIVPLDALGKVCVFTLRAAHAVIDVAGYVPSGSAYAPVTPARVMDTRFDGVSIDHVCEATGRVASGTSASVPVVGRAGVPTTGVGAVVLNVTTLGAKRPGFVTAFVPETPMPVASTVNFVPQDLVSNSVIAPVDASGRVALFVNTGAHLVVDVVGWLPGTATATPGATCTGTFVDPRQTRQLAVPEGGRFGCALLNDRDVQCWYTAMIGFRFNEAITQPFTGSLLELASANGALCALRSDGTVTCLQGRPSSATVEIAFEAPIVDIMGFGHTSGFCAIDTSARTWCWTPTITPSVAGPSPVMTSGPAIGLVSLSMGGGPLAVRTSSGTADVIVNEPDGRFTVAWTSTEAVRGHPWSTVLAASPSYSGDMCLVLVDGRAVCGTSGDLAPGLDVEWIGGGSIRDPLGRWLGLGYDVETGKPIVSETDVRLIRPTKLEDCYYMGAPPADLWCLPNVPG